LENVAVDDVLLPQYDIVPNVLQSICWRQLWSLVYLHGQRIYIRFRLYG